MQFWATATVMFFFVVVVCFFPPEVYKFIRYYNFNLGKILLRKYFELQLKAAGELHFFPKLSLIPETQWAMKHIQGKADHFHQRKEPPALPNTSHRELQYHEVGSVETEWYFSHSLTLQQDRVPRRGSWPRQRAKLMPGERERGVVILWFKRSHLIHTPGIWTHKKRDRPSTNHWKGIK